MYVYRQIRYILSDDDDAQAVQLGDHPLFTQMDVLVHFADNTVGWKEISRSDYSALHAISTDHISGPASAIGPLCACVSVFAL